MHPNEAERVRDLTAVINMIERRCGINAEASKLLHELMTAARVTGKGGVLEIKLKVAPDKNDELALTIEGSVKATIPKTEAKKALIYHDAETKTFSRTDPRQLELLAEKEEARLEREAELSERGIAQIGRGVPATATA